MGLQRTPPPRTGRLSPNPQVTQEQANGASPFKPLNPGVMRSPPRAGSSQVAPSPAQQLQPITTPVPQELEEEPEEDDAEEREQVSMDAAVHTSLIVDDRPIRPAPAIVVQETSMSMEVDEPEPEENPSRSVAEEVSGDVEMEETPQEPGLQERPNTPPAPAASTRPRQSRARQSHIQTQPHKQPIQAPVTPKTPRSRSRARQSSLPAPPAPLQTNDASQENEQWGKRYKHTVVMLERGVKAGAQRWTAEDLKGCLPKLSLQMPKAVENSYLSASQSMSSNILANAHALLTHYKAGPALQAIDEIDIEARNFAASHPDPSVSADGITLSVRTDAWRPDISPQALVAATLLPLYDETWKKLRDEYLELHEDCQDRYTSILSKQAELKALEETVGNGSVELDNTLKALGSLPLEEMSLWTEAAETKMEARVPERGD